MAKTKTEYHCQNCGSKSPKWIGKCPACGEWNTYVEEIVSKASDRNFAVREKAASITRPVLINEVTDSAENRIDTLNNEFNRVLGGGLVLGSMVLIGGEPGIGKSTLALQIALNLKKHKTLYISGEESEQQIKMRANRIKFDQNQCYIFTETLFENIALHIDKLNPDIIVIDSIQTIYTNKIESTPGSVSQVRECTNQLMVIAKSSDKPVLLVGHITKEGSLAGPKVLEHMVDTVLQFEGDRNHVYRILRAVKNRFGSTSELGIFQMNETGLREVQNPSELLLSDHEESLSGVSISANMEGIRPFLIEVQALVSTAAYGTPQRSSTGFDLRRLSMLLAVLEKRAGFRLAAKDVFLNIAGGIKVNDPAIDLAVVCSVFSSDQDIPIDKGICFAGEVGLSGEIRPVTRIEQRIGEAEKLGFKQIFISKYNKKGIESKKYSIEILVVSKVEEVFRALFLAKNTD